MPGRRHIPRRTRPGDDLLRPLALERIYRIRLLRLHAGAFGIGVPLLAALWFVSDKDPWFLLVVGLWTIALAAHALATLHVRHGRRPVTQAEVDRELARLRRGG